MRPKLFRITGLLLIAATAALGLSVQAASRALATAPCGVPSNYFDGFGLPSNVNAPTYFEGISAGMTVRSGGLCGGSTSDNFNDGWVMIADSDGVGWSQSGFERTGPGQPSVVFSQQYEGSAGSSFVTKIRHNGDR